MASKKKSFRICLASNTTEIKASSLKELQSRGCRQLQISTDDVRHVSLQDGRILDDRLFEDLPANTLIQFVRTPTAESMESLRTALAALTLIHRDVILDALRDPQRPQQSHHLDMLQVLSKELNMAEDLKDDPQWFKDLSKRDKKKSKVMGKVVEDRMRSYLQRVTSYVTNSKLLGAQKEIMDQQIINFKERLKKETWYRYYFSRSSSHDGKMCDSRGLFHCEGSYDQDVCPFNHSINPYSSRQDRLVFRSWNLDHRIELRTILSKMIEAVTGAMFRYVNWDYFYSLLFTRDNLRLVHVACHDQKKHSGFQLDESKIYLARAAPN